MVATTNKASTYHSSSETISASLIITLKSWLKNLNYKITTKTLSKNKSRNKSVGSKLRSQRRESMWWRIGMKRRKKRRKSTWSLRSVQSAQTIYQCCTYFLNSWERETKWRSHQPTVTAKIWVGRRSKRKTRRRRNKKCWRCLSRKVFFEWIEEKKKRNQIVMC
jgi:hypothetical protein